MRVKCECHGETKVYVDAYAQMPDGQVTRQHLTDDPICPRRVESFIGGVDLLEEYAGFFDQVRLRWVRIEHWAPVV